MSSMEYCRFRCSKIIEIIENRGKLSTDFKHTLCNVFQTKIVFRIFFLVVKKTPTNSLLYSKIQTNSHRVAKNNINQGRKRIKGLCEV